MSPLEQRIAIAQTFGWEMIPGEKPAHFGAFLGLLDGKTGFIPDYLSDLNAMHEAEKTMPAKDGIPWKYNACIERLMREEWERNDFEPECLNFWSAPAHIRAEAYVKTLGLWKEDDA